MRVLDSFAPDSLQDDAELAAIVQFAARLCDVPIAQVTLVEQLRQRFLSGLGLDVCEASRDGSFCAEAMLSPGLMEVRDATGDPRFASHAMVTSAPAIRFYAGQPLISAEGVPLGALCVIGTVVRPDGLTALQRQGMEVLGQAVMRRLNAQRESIRAEREIALREDRLQRILEGMPQIAWSADAEGNFDYFNARWEKQIGAAPPGSSDEWQRFIHPDDHEMIFADWYGALRSGEEFAAEYRLRFADGSYRWVMGQALPVTEADGTKRWFGTVTDVHELRQALEQRDMIASELSHRIKNIFAVMIGLATLKVRKTPEHQPYADELVEVLRALGRAHDFVQPGAASAQDRLQGLLAALFAPYSDNASTPRVLVSGADSAIGLNAATPLALVFHELATNSAKYGALSGEVGHVTLAVEDRGEHIALNWAEHGGPPAVDSGQDGFGSRLVEMSVKGQLGGSWERRFTPDGLVVQLTVSKKSIAR